MITALPAAIDRALPPLADPDLDELQRAGARANVAVRISTAARYAGRPPIELRAPSTRSCSLLASFTTARAAIDWLQPRRTA